jgi:DNA-binding transcriptional regulator YiaG
MSNIGTVLRDEIARLSRRTIRGEVGGTKKATAQHRRDIAELKRKVTHLERQVALLVRRTLSRQDASTPAPAAAGKRMRFVAKGLRSQRNRLGLSAAEFGQLAGVSAQSIYNWERGSAVPRAEQLARLATLRGMGKREAGARLKSLLSGKGATRRKA